MRDLGSELERRETLRHRPNAPCDVHLAGSHHPGVAVDVSRGGLLVETDAPAWPGALLRVRLGDRDRYGLVLRERHVPHRVRPLVPRAFAVRWLSVRERH